MATMKSTLLLGLLLLALLDSCATAIPTGSLVEYQRSGGFAGFDDRLVIDTNGKATLSRKTVRHEFTLSPSAIERLIAAFDRSDFGKLGGEYLPMRQANDLIEYTVTYKSKTVRTRDTAIPDTLGPVLDLLNQIVMSDGVP